jgi:hypothetical protein
MTFKVLNKQIVNDIEKAKNKLRAKARRYGISEMFGNTEIRFLQGKYAEYENEFFVKLLLNSFSNWCYDYEGGK